MILCKSQGMCSQCPSSADFSCVLTWKNVSTCCLGASSLRTGYVHLPIMSYIAFIMSSISWKAKDCHVRLHAVCETPPGEALTDYSYSISHGCGFFKNFLQFFIKCLLVVPEEKPTESKGKRVNSSDVKAEESECKNQFCSWYQNEINSHISNMFWKETFWFNVWTSTDST